MREIFTELYKKVLGFFQTEEKEASESKTVAINRMKLVLMQDRTNLTPFLLEKMRGEMIEVLAKYVEMDKEALELNFEQEGEQMALMLSIPVIRAKDEEEIQAAIEAEEKAKAENTQEEIEEISENEEEADCEQRLEGETTLSPGTPFNASNQADEDTDEDIEENTEEDVCTAEAENEETIDESASPDEIEETEEETTSKKSKKKN